MILSRAWRALEAFLRIRRLGSGWAILQFRAIYTILIGFGFLQLVNFFVQLPSYGGWSPYLLVSVFFFLSPAPLVLTLRWINSPIPMTCLMGVLILLGIGLPAMPDNTGIDTSVIPYLVVAPAILSFIGGWRAGLVFFPAGLALLVALAENAVPGTPGLLVGLTPLQQLRFSQAVIALGVATCAACALSAAAQSAIIGVEKARSRADAAEASQSQFLAAMSHELRTPMNAVIGLTGVLLSDEDKNLTAKQRQLLDTIDGAGRQLLAVVDDILNISKLDADMVAIAPEPFQLRKMLTSLVQTFSANAEAKQLDLSLDVLPEVSEFVEGDDLRLRQIVSNLLSNAIKFTEAGSVSVRAGVLPGRPEWIWIEVQDTGCGIPKEKSDAVFNPFEQAESGSVRRHDGTGLGLAICRRLTELMGGEINLKNTGPDGTTFVVMLPLPPTHGAGFDQRAEEESTDTRLDGLEVLVVEDNLVNQLVIKEILKMLGASPRFAGNGIEALETLANCHVDVVLMDKHMPEMNGIETTHAIRSSGETWADIPIIAATADAMEGEEAAMLEAGMDGFVPKPVRSAELATTVRRVLAEVAAQPTDEAASGTT